MLDPNSNLMVASAGYLAGELTGTTWAQLLQTNILNPLGMSSTLATPAAVKARGNFVQPYITTSNNTLYLADLDLEYLFINESPAGKCTAR